MIFNQRRLGSAVPAAFDMTPLNYSTTGIGDDLPQNQPAESFIWGAGGAKLTPEQILAREEIARSQMQSDFSPVQHWTQGLGRVADNIMGALDARALDKESKASNADRAAMIAQMLGPDNADLVGAVSSGDRVIAGLAGDVLERRSPKATAPHYWETNDGSLGMVGPNGQPTILYRDPTPKLNWITADNGDGTKSLIPVGPNGPVGSEGGGQTLADAGAASTLPAIGSVIPDPRKGGVVSNGGNPFP